MKRNQGSSSKNSNQRLDEEIEAIFASSDRDEYAILKGMKGAPATPTKVPLSPKEGWAVVKSPKDILAKPIEKWKGAEFKLYWDGVLHLQKMKMTLNPGIAYISKCVRDIRIEYQNQTNSVCTNEWIKNYSEWFFIHKHKPIIGKRAFGYNMLSQGINIKEYLQRAESRPQPVVPVVLQPSVVKPVKKVPIEEIHRKLSISYQGVLLTYGLVIAYNYLLAVVKLTPLEVNDRTAKTLSSLMRADKKAWDAIAAATEKYGPYPKQLCFDPELMIAGLETTISAKLKRIKIVEGDNASLSFLKAQ